MGKLDRYIGKSVFFAILSVLGIIVGLALLFAYVDQMSDLTDSYGLGEAAWYVLLTAPRRVYDLLPMASLIGCLIGLGTLASNSELTIMRAAGVSIGRIVWAVMKPMLVLMVCGVLIGEYVAPYSENQAQADRAVAQIGDREEAQSGRHGVWHIEGNQYIHINVVQPNGVLFGITRYQFDDQRHMQSASFAKRGDYAGTYWNLTDITTTRFNKDTTDVVNADKEHWDIQLSPQLLSTVAVEPEALPASGLWDYIHYLSAQGLNNSNYWLAFWTKVFQPLVTAALVLMAISFIFGPLRSVTLGQRVFTGVVVGFVFRIIQDLLGPSSQVFGFSPILAVVLPAAVCAVGGVLLLRRAG